jgi:hypothetical protein
MSGEPPSGECSTHVDGIGSCARVDNKCCASTVPSSQYYPYTIGCFRGCPHREAVFSSLVNSVQQQRAGCVQVTRGVTANFSPVLSLGHNLTINRLISSPSADAPVFSDVTWPAMPGSTTSANTSAGRDYVAAARELFIKQQLARASLPNSDSPSSQTLIKNPFNRSLAIANVSSPDVAAYSGVSDFSAATVAMNYLPDARYPKFDFQITSVVHDPALSRVYFATPGGLFSMAQTGGRCSSP